MLQLIRSRSSFVRRHSRFRHALAKPALMHGTRIFDQVTKVGQRRQRPRRQQLLDDCLVDRAPHGNVPVSSAMRSDRLHGRLADAAGGRVDHSLQRNRVIRIGDDLQVRNHVLDLGALVEAEPSHNVVLHLIAAHCLFHQAGLRVGAIQDRRARRLAMFSLGLPQILGDVVRGEQRLVLAVGSFVVADLCSATAGPSTGSCPCA